MKLRTLGLLSASFVVAQLMSMNAMATTDADAKFTREATGSVVLDEAAYQATGNKKTDHRKISAAIEKTLETNGNIVSFSKVHMGASDNSPFTATEKADMQNILTAVKAVHVNQGKTVNHIKTHIRGLKSPSDPTGHFHASVVASTADAAEMMLKEGSYEAADSREETHSRLTNAFSKTGSNAREIIIAAKGHHSHHTGEEATPDDTKHHSLILGSLNTTHGLQKVVVEMAAKHYGAQTKANS